MNKAAQIFAATKKSAVDVRVLFARHVWIQTAEPHKLK
jgi:hypothetical protein